MDDYIISQFKMLLRPQDSLYVLGDVCYWKDKSYIDRANDLMHQIPGEKFLILGNHDKKTYRKMDWYEWAKDIAEIKIEDKKIVLFHYPMRSWNAKYHGSYHLFGHVHGRMPTTDLSMDVGVDSHSYCPVSWHAVKIKMQEKIASVDSAKI
jgi:calcineurin-like phosphoesterase family protein